MDTFFFIASKIIWLLISPDAFLLLLSILGLFCLFLNKIKLAKILLSLSIISFSLIACLPIDEWLAYPLESRFTTNPDLPEEIDGIIVLGGSKDPVVSYIWDQIELNSSSERDFAFLELAKRFSDAQLIFSGGSGQISKQGYKEADIARSLYTSFDITPSRVIYERNSRNTYENIVNSKALANPKANENWILITSASHMSRSVGLFCQQGWPVIPYPVDHNTTPGELLRVEFNFAENLEFLRTTIHEWLGLIAHRLSGKTNSFLPTTC